MIDIIKEIFSEGQTLGFKILRVVILPDNNEYYLLESLVGNRYMMRKSYYENYNLKIGSVINCNIDKINCSGKIFMEPEHPVYRTGSNYGFKVVDVFSENNIFEKEIRGYVVEDLFKNKIKVISKVDRKQQPEFLNCFIVRIKKGIPVLSINNFSKFNDKIIS